MNKIFLPIVIALLISLVACTNNTTKTKTNDESSDSSSMAGLIEPHRPQFHFTPDSMWMNDPNGMVYHNNEYHLYYQYYPDSTVWGPMHWGHAVSKDLIHWQHLPIALFPDSLGYIFSGSAVIDKNNTSGLGSPENPPMVAIFTYHSMKGQKSGKKDYETQGLAYSLDNGRTWEKYKQNPVLKNPGIEDFRDPKVSWHEGSNQWVMILAVTDHIELYGSKNLKEWAKLSEFGKNYGAHGGVWECPDLFPLTIDGRQKWVMLVSVNPGGIHGGSATQYFIGNFDGKKFTSDNRTDATLWIDYGKDNYAGVTWSNIPSSDGRRLFLGWMSNWQYANVVPTALWRSAMTIPRELSLKNTNEGIRIVAEPVKELSSIRGESFEIRSQSVEGREGVIPEVPFDVSTSEILLEFDSIRSSKDFGIELSNTKSQTVLIGYESAANVFYIDRTGSGKKDFSKEFAGKHTAPRKSLDKSIRLQLLIDVASIELFADNGEVVMTDIFFPDENYNQLKLYAKDGSVKLKSGKITHLRSIWKEKVALLQK
ncbi:MAG: glycoside hydrolase family 32 protein [Chitinophagaceae bacterium]